MRSSFGLPRSAGVARANDIRGAAYCPRPDGRVRRAVHKLLNEGDANRRGQVAAWMVAALVLLLVLAGARW